MEIDDVQSQVRINFSFANYLAPGKYLLVAALEDIRSAGASYFEYVEGAHYFSVVSSKKLMEFSGPMLLLRLMGLGMSEMDINSHEYWNGRFERDWESI